MKYIFKGLFRGFQDIPKNYMDVPIRAHSEKEAPQLQVAFIQAQFLYKALGFGQRSMKRYLEEE